VCRLSSVDFDGRDDRNGSLAEKIWAMPTANVCAPPARDKMVFSPTSLAGGQLTGDIQFGATLNTRPGSTEWPVLTVAD